MSILEGSFAAEVADALDNAGVPYDLTLARPSVPVTSPASDRWNPAEPIYTEYPAKGFVDDLGAGWRADGTISSDVQIRIIANSIAVEPQPGDVITTPTGARWVAQSVAVDPAGATYVVSTHR